MRIAKARLEETAHYGLMPGHGKLVRSGNCLQVTGSRADVLRTKYLSDCDALLEGGPCGFRRIYRTRTSIVRGLLTSASLKSTPIFTPILLLRVIKTPATDKMELLQELCFLQVSSICLLLVIELLVARKAEVLLKHLLFKTLRSKT